MFTSWLNSSGTKPDCVVAAMLEPRMATPPPMLIHTPLSGSLSPARAPLVALRGLAVVGFCFSGSGGLKGSLDHRWRSGGGGGLRGRLRALLVWAAASGGPPGPAADASLLRQHKANVDLPFCGP